MQMYRNPLRIMSIISVFLDYAYPDEATSTAVVILILKILK